jgi:hypothetical protein
MRKCEDFFRELKLAFSNIPKAFIYNLIKLLQYLGLYQNKFD